MATHWVTLPGQELVNIYISALLVVLSLLLFLLLLYPLAQVLGT